MHGYSIRDLHYTIHIYMASRRCGGRMSSWVVFLENCAWDTAIWKDLWQYIYCHIARAVRVARNKWYNTQHTTYILHNTWNTMVIHITLGNTIRAAFKGPPHIHSWDKTQRLLWCMATAFCHRCVVCAVLVRCLCGKRGFALFLTVWPWLE